MCEIYYWYISNKYNNILRPPCIFSNCFVYAYVTPLLVYDFTLFYSAFRWLDKKKILSDLQCKSRAALILR